MRVGQSLRTRSYGSDVIAPDNGAEKGEAYNPRRGAKVIASAEAFWIKPWALPERSFPTLPSSPSRTQAGAND